MKTKCERLEKTRLSSRLKPATLTGNSTALLNAVFFICDCLFVSVCQPCISRFPIARNAVETRSRCAGVAHGGRRRSECFAHLHLKRQDTYTSTICAGLFNGLDRLGEVLRDVPS